MSPTSYQLLHPALFGSANVRLLFKKVLSPSQKSLFYTLLSDYQVQMFFFLLPLLLTASKPACDAKVNLRSIGRQALPFRLAHRVDKLENTSARAEAEPGT